MIFIMLSLSPLGKGHATSIEQMWIPFNKDHACMCKVWLKSAIEVVLEKEMRAWKVYNDTAWWWKGQTIDKFWSAFSSGDLIVFPKFQPRDFHLNYHGMDPRYKCCSLWQCLLSSRNPWSFGLGHSDNHFSLRNYMLQDLEGNTLQI